MRILELFGVVLTELFIFALKESRPRKEEDAARTREIIFQVCS